MGALGLFNTEVADPMKNVDDTFGRTLSEYRSKTPTPASLRMLMKTGMGDEKFPGQDLLSNGHIMANYLRTELPIRLAQRIQDLDHMPRMRDMEEVLKVKGIYLQSFRELVAQFPSPIVTDEVEQDFARTLSRLYTNHSSVLVQMAKGAFQLREEIRKRQREERRLEKLRQQVKPPTMEQRDDIDTTPVPDFESLEDCHHFLDRFYISRIGIRFLAGQYLTLREPPKDDHIGMICLRTSPSACVHQAAADASLMCRRTFGRCPRIEVSGCLDLTFPYIPTYLHYILVELIKNALRATMETHEAANVLPIVRVIIADGTENEDVVIKIADEGGGIPRSQMDKVWSYLYTTASPKVQQSFIGDSRQSDFSKQSPLAGLGYGLPIARSYCRYFGGELDLLSMEGFGTDAFVHLKRLGDYTEPVPF